MNIKTKNGKFYKLVQLLAVPSSDKLGRTEEVAWCIEKKTNKPVRILISDIETWEK